MSKVANKRASKGINLIRGSVSRTENKCRSRIPIPNSRTSKHKLTSNPTKSNLNPKSQKRAIESPLLPPEITYGKDRSRLSSSYSKRRPDKSGMESEITIKYRKYNLEKTKLIAQQFAFQKEYEEMRALLDKLKNVNYQGVAPNERELTINECEHRNMLALFKKFENGEELSGVGPFVQGQTRNDLTSVHHKCMNANAEIFSILKRLGDKAIQLYCHQTIGNNKGRQTDDIYFFQNVLKLKGQFFGEANERNETFLEYEKALKQYQDQVSDLQEKLALAEQKLIAEEAKTKSFNVSRENSFLKTEEKLRDVISKFQNQFKMQKLLQEKTVMEMDTLRSKCSAIESDNSNLKLDLNKCKCQLEDYSQIVATLEEKVFECERENEQLIQKYENQLKETQMKTLSLENKLKLDRMTERKDSPYNLHNSMKISQLTVNMEELQSKLFEAEGEIYSLQQVLKQKSNKNSERLEYQQENVILKNQADKVSKMELNAEELMVKNQSARILNVQKLPAVREVLLHELKMKRPNHKTNTTPQKSLWRAYLCWLVGGVFGLHHLYLGRDRQAFIWWSTLGGYFLVGWTNDLFRMPEMVRDANDDPKFIEKLKESIRKNQRPPFATNKFIGQIMISYLWCQVFMMAIPKDEYHGVDFGFLHWLIPFVVALGVWNVGNLGRQRGTIWKCLITSYVVYPIRYVVYEESYWLTTVIVVAAIVFENYSKEWLLTPPKKRSKKCRFLRFSVACCLYLGLLGCYFYFNGKITDSEGDEVPVHEAISNFFKSPWWTDLKNSLNETWKFAKHHGFYETWKQMIDMLDADGEQNAFKTLGLPPTATQSEITATFRKLSKENHPDKVKGTAEKKIAQEKFMEISHAYEVLSKIKSKRKQKNKRSTSQ